MKVLTRETGMESGGDTMVRSRGGTAGWSADEKAPRTRCFLTREPRRYETGLSRMVSFASTCDGTCCYHERQACTQARLAATCIQIALLVNKRRMKPSRHAVLVRKWPGFGQHQPSWEPCPTPLESPSAGRHVMNVTTTGQILPVATSTPVYPASNQLRLHLPKRRQIVARRPLSRGLLHGQDRSLGHSLIPRSGPSRLALQFGLRRLQFNTSTNYMQQSSNLACFSDQILEFISSSGEYASLMALSSVRAPLLNHSCVPIL